jgi:hypothetical protein
MAFLDKAAAALKRYKAPFPVAKTKSLTKQLNEYYGVSDFHCKEHATLVENLMTMRNSYANADSSETKKRIAKAELLQWHKYINSRTEANPLDFEVPEPIAMKFRKLWDKLRNRGEENISCSRMLDFHFEYIEHFKFDLNIDEVCLSELVHPHFGYLTNMPGTLSFDQLMLLIKRKLFASYERFEGEDLLAKQISALAYWEIVDFDYTGVIDLNDLNRLLAAFKIPEVSDLDDVRNRFSYTLATLPNELAHLPQRPFMRFEFIRKLFIERNL